MSVYMKETPKGFVDFNQACPKCESKDSVHHTDPAILPVYFVCRNCSDKWTDYGWSNAPKNPGAPTFEAKASGRIGAFLVDVDSLCSLVGYRHPVGLDDDTCDNLKRLSGLARGWYDHAGKITPAFATEAFEEDEANLSPLSQEAEAALAKFAKRKHVILSWIPVDEKLPETTNPDQIFLVTTRAGEVSLAHWGLGYWWAGDSKKGYDVDHVAFWANLPKSPVEAKEDA